MSPSGSSVCSLRPPRSTVPRTADGTSRVPIPGTTGTALRPTWAAVAAVAEVRGLTGSAVAGRVVIDCDPDTARVLMQAFWAAHEADQDLQAARPGWFGDVVELLVASAEADVQAGTAPKPVLVPLLRGDRPRLRLVAGGAS